MIGYVFNAIIHVTGYFGALVSGGSGSVLAPFGKFFLMLIMFLGGPLLLTI